MAMLEEMLLKHGGKALAGIIAKRFGPEMAELATDALAALGEAFGVAPEPAAIEKRITEIAATDPERATGGVAYAEMQIAPRLLAEAELWKAANESQRMANQLLEAQIKEGGLAGAWLWIWQYFLMFVWAWSLVLVHLVNAGVRLLGGTPLPAVDLTILMALTGAYLALHMGGHTVLELMRGGAFKRGPEAVGASQSAGWKSGEKA